VAIQIPNESEVFQKAQDGPDVAWFGDRTNIQILNHFLKVNAVRIIWIGFQQAYNLKSDMITCLVLA
jgi:hypothetical protein